MRPVLAFLLLLFPAGHAAAEELIVSTSTHVGYGLVARSTEGFKNVGGSLAFFDISVPLMDKVEGGLRSLAQGGKTASAQFYRLGSGPFVSWEAFEDLFLQVTLNAYRESQMNAEGVREKDVPGRTWMAGTQRLMYRSARVDAGWGGFVAKHVGGGASSVVRGVDVSLRLRL